jgi:hypothetical protein
MINASISPKDDLEVAAIDEFGGLPSGEAFPNSTFEIDQQIDAGNFIRLMTVEDYEDAIVNDELFYSSAYGWCFNDTGNEARVTTYNYKHANGWMQNVYWKLELEITTFGTESSGEATITKLEEKIIARGGFKRSNGKWQTNTHGGLFPMRFYLPEGDNWYTVNMPSSPWTDHADDINEEWPTTRESVVWVGWIDGDWHEVVYRWVKFVKYYRAQARAKIWPNDELGSGKISIDHTGPIPPGIDQDSYGALRIIYLASFARNASGATFFTIGDGETTNSADEFVYEIISNAPVPKWSGKVVRGHVYTNGSTEIVKIEQVRQFIIEERSRDEKELQLNFACAPYNRNAYYIQHREYQEGWKLYNQLLYRWMESNAYYWIIRNTDIGVYFYPTNTPDLPVETYEPPLAADGDPFSVTPGPSLGTWPFEYNTSALDKTVAGLDCPSPIYKGFPEWYVDTSTFGNPGGSNDAWPVGVRNIQPYYWVDNPSWIPTPPCGPIDSPKEASNWWDVDHPYLCTGVMQSQNLPLGPDHYINKTYLVADRTPSEPGVPKFLGDIPIAEDGHVWDTTPFAFCQTAMLGEKAIIYADNSQTKFVTGFGYYAPILTEGEMPEVIEAGPLDNDRQWLTFIGVNNE